MKLRSRAMLAFFASSWFGCGRAFQYPLPEKEVGGLACRDGEDNDLDGDVDCKDHDCDGACQEETQAECSDRRDNDGDGLVDGADPRCWAIFPPLTKRCASAQGVEFVETFEAMNPAGPSWGSWHAHDSRVIVEGDFPLAASEESILDVRGGFLTFSGSANASQPLDVSLGALVRERLFAGSWKDFELSFKAHLFPGAALRVAIAPVELVPGRDRPRAGATEALVAVTLDRSVEPPVLELVVEGERVSTPLPDLECEVKELLGASSKGSLSGACPGSEVHVSVAFDGDSFSARATDERGGARTTLAAAPSSRSIPASRLVLWGGSTGARSLAAFRDLRLSVKPHWPCGYAVPQISSCTGSGANQAFGRSLSVARDPRGEYCALVGVSADANSPITRLTAWASEDGTSWTDMTSELPAAVTTEAATLVGAGIARDDRGFHVAIAGRGPEGTRVSIVRGESCGRWETELVKGPSLPEDAEPPSYVIARGQQAVYFTRPPNTETLRTLWRVTPHADAQPELLAELPADVGSPVSVGLIGASDLVLTYPSAASSGRSGVGLLIGEADFRRWLSVEPSPILALPRRFESYEGQTSFDDRGLVAAALTFRAEGGFLLYSGLSVAGWTGVGFSPILSVGTAELSPVDLRGFPEESSTPDPCGDGVCGPLESCVRCEQDCGCEASLDTSIELDRAATGGVHWRGGSTSWERLPLDRVIDGDFELSFDGIAGATDSMSGCTLYVGLGSGADPDSDAPSAGAFARLKLVPSCPDRYSITPVVRTKSKLFGVPSALESSACEARHLLTPDTWRRVVLRRRAGRLTVQVRSSEPCAESDRTTEYAGALPALDALYIGFGGPGFETCPKGRGAGTLDNFELRLLEDPADCPTGSVRCAEGDVEPSCVDLADSPEHCGACDNACTDFEDCVNGRCTCKSDLAGILSCAGECVDGRSSIDHCGTCGNACDYRCAEGHCDTFGPCTSPFQVPPEGGSFVVKFARSADAHLIDCPETSGVARAAVANFSALGWQPERNGSAIVELDVQRTTLDTWLGVAQTLDRQCRAWDACNDNAGGALSPGSRLEFPVTAGDHYWVGLGLFPGVATPDKAEAELRIHFR